MPAAQPVQEPAAPASTQAPHPAQQAIHSATNGIVEHKQPAQQVEPPSEREVPMASASTADQDIDQDMQEADGQASAGMAF